MTAVRPYGTASEGPRVTYVFAERRLCTRYKPHPMTTPFDDSGTHSLPLESGVAFRTSEITVIDGPDRGARLRLARRSTRIGTAVSNELRLHDKTVSRLHCEIHLRRDSLRVVDCGSTNGTSVDGIRVRDADVVPGATIRIGTTSLRLEALDETFQVPLSPRARLGGLLGASVPMRQLYAIVERVAPTDATVLIQGETGSGKELVAREFHRASQRAEGPFVAVDCASIAPTVIESELFGHMRGSFSGALADRKGLFEEAHGGTLFLDEVGELPLPLQGKLLRTLETREVRRVGSNTPRPVNVRLLAATNRPLAQAVNEGLFREELYHRLAVVEVSVPPLRARREDIGSLAQYFCERFGMRTPLSPDVVSSLTNRAWPGNVRELRNYIERYAALATSAESAPPPMVDAEMPATFEALIQVHIGFKEARDAFLARFEAFYGRSLLRRTGGNVTRAAELADVSRRFFQRLMMRSGLRDDDGP
jgi:DNA-binding NtrC family response regulator